MQLCVAMFRLGLVRKELRRASYGQRLLSEVCRLPSPSGLLLSCWALLLSDFQTRPRTRCSCNHGQWWDVAENFLMDRRHDGAVSSTHFSFLARRGLCEKHSDRTEFPVRSSSRAEHEKSPAAHFALMVGFTGKSLPLALHCRIGQLSRIRASTSRSISRRQWHETNSRSRIRPTAPPLGLQSWVISL